MTDYVRVADTVTGATYTIHAVTVDPNRHVVVDEPSVDINGQPRGATYLPRRAETGPSAFVEDVTHSDKEPKHA